MLAFALLLLALGPPVTLFDGDLAVPRSRARGIPVKINRPTYVHSKFDTKEPQAQVRAALLTAAGVRAYQDGRPHEILAGTEYAAFGEFRFLVMRPGGIWTFSLSLALTGTLVACSRCSETCSRLVLVELKDCKHLTFKCT